MLKKLLTYEILNLLKSRRVYWTICLFLILFASIFVVRVIDYQRQLNQYIADVHDNEEQLQKAYNYSFLNPCAIQRPLIFSVYNQGFVYPRRIRIQYYEPILSTMSINEKANLIYKQNPKLDITFLFTFFLSLFILLISYDSVNGEKQSGTLRILLTYPIKRQGFILKKLLGIFIFVAITVTIPYLLSILVLTIIFANLLTVNFFLSAFFYWFLVMLFIFFFVLLGTLISCCTINPNRSLVYSLLVWLFLAIILPTSWRHIISPLLHKDDLAQLERNYEDKHDRARRIFYLEELDETKYNRQDLDISAGEFFFWSGAGPFYNIQILSFREMYENRYRFQQYVIDEYYPVSRETEQAMDQIYRKQISLENMKNWIFFYNPIVLLENLGMQITGNSRADRLKFLHDTRMIRGELVNQGISEGWLLDYRFFAVHDREMMYTTGSLADYEKLSEEEKDIFDDKIDDLKEAAEAFSFEMPYILQYADPVYTFGEIFQRIWIYIALFVLNILALWMMTWRKFMRYDVR